MNLRSVASSWARVQSLGMWAMSSSSVPTLRQCSPWGTRNSVALTGPELLGIFDDVCYAEDVHGDVEDTDDDVQEGRSVRDGRFKGRLYAVFTKSLRLDLVNPRIGLHNCRDLGWTSDLFWTSPFNPLVLFVLPSPT